MTTEKILTVADLDSLLPHYTVLNQKGSVLGRKHTRLSDESYRSVYLKPHYNKRGLHVKDGGSEYKNTPPWFKLQVTKIANSNEGLTLYVA